MKTLVLSMISIAATVAAMTACTSESDPINEVESEVNVPVNFGQSINLYTKAITTGDKLLSTTIGIWGQEHSGTPSWAATNFMDNLSLTVDAAGAITYTTESDKKYYSIEAGTKYDFYAYSPIATGSNGLTVNDAGENTAPSIEVTLSSPQTDVTDIMYAKALDNTKSTNSINLGFQHALAQVKFKIKKTTGANATTLTAIKVNANSVGTMNITDGSFTSTGTPINFEISSLNTSIGTSEAPIDKSLLLFPETLGTNSVTFTIDGNDYSFTPTATLTAGKITTIAVEVSATDVTFNQSITDWSNESEGSGTIK